MAAKKSGKLRTEQGSGDKPKRTLPQALRAHTWKPGQSGNPGGRPKKLTQPLEDFLARKDKKGRQYAQLLIEAMVTRLHLMLAGTYNNSGPLSRHCCRNR
jgi:hypothetical protein